ncbi:uncharacterized protein MYCFIDRAFT_82412 [Pseudocercospora fijiensis CIRAD86]|uniref:Uncharacterized protein n=1 Tax=Pseudocercospora fijiensis (strain CIRAD86) TaxID=383855 RepID=M2ZU26_PSEFD|nr:uncharacterized protein MYCFIDRAFT_82412 [Pseudocercospora fijiensis CIRAD86]EME82509.1 hypothetical protein MYCFIDRAFT_82412 [Pseudocercospora fijiensis CIRAD86]
MDSMIYTFESLRIEVSHFISEAARANFSPEVLVVAPMPMKYPNGASGTVVPGTRLFILHSEAVIQQKVFSTFPCDWAWATNWDLRSCTRPTDDVVDLVRPEGETPEQTSLWEDDEDELYDVTPTKARVRPAAKQQPMPKSSGVNKRHAEDANAHGDGLTKRSRDD